MRGSRTVSSRPTHALFRLFAVFAFVVFFFVVGRFAAFHGTSGPDGLAMLPDGRLLVAHASLRCVFVLSHQGEVEARIEACRGTTVTMTKWWGVR